MIDGVYNNPTKIFFGKDLEFNLGEEIAKYSNKILLHYGGGSIKKFGLYDKIVDSLKATKVEYVELSGVKPNPRASLVYQGIELCQKEKINFILAVGGGSVIDSAKAIGIGVPWAGDFFDFYEGKAIPEQTLKVATVLTVVGTGSESSGGSVITHEEKNLKLGYSNPLMAPVFSVLNPENTFTLPYKNTICGIVDAISHVLEMYFTNTTYVDCTDRIGEGLIKTLMKYAVLVKDQPENYDIRAEIMWASKLANDNTAGFGRKQDWSSHRIAHGLGAIYDNAHGGILSVVLPAWMSFVYQTNLERFSQFAERVFDLKSDPENQEQVIISAIEKFKQFLTAVGMPTTLRQLGINEKDHFQAIAKDCVRFMPSGTIGNFLRLSDQDIINILENAY